jgi:hypothetical protein
MTYLQIVNKVLKRLRESAVTSVSEDDYTSLVAEFVAQALSEVEDAWDWNVLRNTVQVTTVSTDFSYVLTGVGVGFKVFDVHEDTEDYDLTKAPYHKMNHWLLNDDAETDAPKYWDVNGVDGNGDPVVNFYPIPDGVYTVNFNLKSKTDLSDDTTGTTSIVVPWLPVVLRATFLAVEERGDDQGLSLEALERQFTTALSNAVSYDAALHADETVWEVE